MATRYLYGDSSAFPLNENFLETLAACTEACAQLLVVDDLLHKARRTEEDADNAASSEQTDIESLAQSVEQALAQRGHLSGATQKLAAQVASEAKKRFEKARTGVKAWRDDTVTKAYAPCGPKAIAKPLQRFLVSHQLPYTTWGLRWKSGRGDEPVQSQVYAIMQRGLTATMAVEIPKKHVWSQPMKVGYFEKKFPLQIMGKGLFGKEKMRDESLEKYFVTRVTRTTEREAIILGKKAKEASEGLRLSMREGEVSRVSIIRVDDNENPIGEAHVLQGKDAGTANRLWTQIVDTIMELVPHRSKLLQVAMYGKAATELESPATVALAMIQSLGPLVRDLARHSPSSTELALKRDLGDGKREELFISHREIIDKYDKLKPRYREMFEAYGLEERTAVKSQKKPSSYPPPAQEVPSSWSMAPPAVQQVHTASALPVDMSHMQVYPSVPPSSGGLLTTPQPHFPPPAAIPAEAQAPSAPDSQAEAQFVDAQSHSDSQSVPSMPEMGYRQAPNAPPPTSVALPAPSAPPPRKKSSHPPSGPAPGGGEPHPQGSAPAAVSLPKPSVPPPKRGPKAVAS